MRLPWLRRPRHADRQALGQRSEHLARRFLHAQGYTIEAINLRYPVGEIDILAREGATLCFVEVRSTSSEAWGGPLATIGLEKQRRQRRAADWFLSRHRLPSDIRELRFDVVAVAWREEREPSVELIRGAFDAG